MISGIILASGFSKRMQREKLLLPVDGTALVERVIQAARQSMLDETVLVYQHEQVREIGERHHIRTVWNAASAEGQSAAVRLGVQAAMPGTQAYMFFVGDQPFLRADIINQIITAWQAHKTGIIVPAYRGVPGNPVIFPAAYQGALLALQGDSGGRTVIAAHKGHVVTVSIEDAHAGIDIDTAAEYEAATSNQGRHSVNK